MKHLWEMTPEERNAAIKRLDDTIGRLVYINGKAQFVGGKMDDGRALAEALESKCSL